jgi:hypothetical protein
VTAPGAAEGPDEDAAARGPRLDGPRPGPAGQQGRVHPAGMMTRRAARQAPGVVKVRLSGNRAGIDLVAAVLADSCEVLDRSRPRPNHYDPGERIYLTIRIGPARHARPLHRT